MQSGNISGRRNNSKSVVSALAALCGAACLALSTTAIKASVIDVVVSRTQASGAGADTTGNSSNNGINPGTYTPSLTTIPDAVTNPGGAPVTYDAADIADSGTQWNTLDYPVNTVANATGGSITTLYQQNLPLANSTGGATGVNLNVSFTENNGKTDTINQTGIISGTNPGSDGLNANPTQLMNQSWFNNGSSEMIVFGLTGLTPGAQYLLYVYGSGQNIGFGGTYTVPTANQGTGYNSASGAYTTEPDGTGSTEEIYRSVFDSTGVNPTPEQGLSWTLLPVQADANGDLTLTVNKDSSSGVKGSINGFQLASVSASVPEPVSAGLLAVGGLMLSVRRRRRA